MQIDMKKTGLLVLLVSAVSSYAQTPVPPDTMHAYDFVIGRWTCKGVTPAGKVDYTITQEVERVPGGRWFRFQDVSSVGSGVSFLTYEPKTHLWRYISIHESGAYSMGTAPDFVGDKQTWTGYTYENGEWKPWGRIVFIKVSDREKREDFYKLANSGKYQFDGSEVCTKLQ